MAGNYSQFAPLESLMDCYLGRNRIRRRTRFTIDNKMLGMLGLSADSFSHRHRRDTQPNVILLNRAQHT